MINLIKIILLILLVQSCSTSLDDSQKNSKTVKELYQHKNYQQDINIKYGNIKYGVIDQNSGFVRTQQNELDNLFPKLSNPTLNMFVYPHLIDNSYPVPGYTTNFKMYKVDHYALPSEVY